jgi:hypothetical protein
MLVPGYKHGTFVGALLWLLGHSGLGLSEGRQEE